jgi:hypothetical protein
MLHAVPAPVLPCPLPPVHAEQDTDNQADARDQAEQAPPGPVPDCPDPAENERAPGPAGDPVGQRVELALA